MALIITSIKILVILPLSLLVLVGCAITVMFHVYAVYHSFVFYCVLLCFYHCILRIRVLIYSAPQLLQECLVNLLTYLLTYHHKR